MYEIPKCIIDATCESEVLKTDNVWSKSQKAVLHRNDEKKKKEAMDRKHDRGSAMLSNVSK